MGTLRCVGLSVLPCKHRRLWLLRRAAMLWRLNRNDSLQMQKTKAGLCAAVHEARLHTGL